MNYDDNDDEVSHYEEDDSDSNDNDNDDDKASGEADDPLKNKIVYWVRLLAGVIRTYQDYGVDPRVALLDASANAPASFEAVELQVPSFFVSYLLVCAWGIFEDDSPICFKCFC
jgi:hypothetical protein